MARIPTFTRLTTLTAGLLLTSGVMVQAQTCTTTFDPLLRQAVTHCTPALPALVYPQIKPFDLGQTLQQAEQIKAQRLQNEILRLQLQELQRQQQSERHHEKIMAMADTALDDHARFLREHQDMLDDHRAQMRALQPSGR